MKHIVGVSKTTGAIGVFTPFYADNTPELDTLPSPEKTFKVVLMSSKPDLYWVESEFGKGAFVNGEHVVEKIEFLGEL